MKPTKDANGHTKASLAKAELERQQYAERMAVERRLGRRITARKHMGDDSESWAVFLDGRPVYTGMNRGSTSYYRRLVLETLLKENP